MYRQDESGSAAEAPDEDEKSDYSEKAPQRRRLQKTESKRKERIDIDEFDSDADSVQKVPVKEAVTDIKPIELKEF